MSAPVDVRAELLRLLPRDRLHALVLACKAALRVLRYDVDRDVPRRALEAIERGDVASVGGELDAWADEVRSGARQLPEDVETACFAIHDLVRYARGDADVAAERVLFAALDSQGLTPEAFSESAARWVAEVRASLQPDLTALLVEHARGGGSVDHFRAVVAEPDGRVTSKDFASLDEAARYADDAAAEAYPSPLAIVVDAAFACVHVGRHFF